MRRYRRIFLLFLFLLPLLLFILPWGWKTSQNWLQRYRQGEWQTFSATVSNSLVYPLREQAWLTFSIPEGTEQLKIISNGHILAPDKLLPEDSLNYILRYQILDKKGQILFDNVYHHRTRLTRYQDDEERIFFGNYYAGYDYAPLDGRLIKLAMEDIAKATTVRIAFIRQSPEIEEVAVRLYMPAKVSEHRLGTLWLRMSEKQKAALAKGSVFPSMLLTESEKRNLLKNQWQAVGPAGVEGRDYSIQTLYVLKEIEHEKLSDAMIAAGLQVDADYFGIIPIPEQGGQLTLNFSFFDGTPWDFSSDVHLEWYGRTRDQRWEKSMAAHSVSDLSLPVQGGMLKISSAGSFLIQASLTTKTGEHLDITPQPLLITAYAADKGVDFNVLHVNERTTAIRIDIRQMFEEPGSLLQQPELIYQWINTEGDIVHQGVIKNDCFPSAYDRLRGDAQTAKVSDPQSYYFSLPVNVSRLRLLTNTPGLLVNAYNQPDRLQKKQRIPEDSFISIDKKDWYPSWFMLRPGNEQSLLKLLAVYKIAGQYRPPEDDPHLLAGQYLWEDYLPVENTEARYLLTIMDKSDYRDQALATVYCQIAENRVQNLNFQAYGNLANVTPELIYLRKQPKAFAATINIDHSSLMTIHGMGQQGVMKLSTLSLGKHAIKLNSKQQGEWFINHVKGCTGKLLSKRRVFRFKNRKLTFLYRNDQSEDKVMSARFFSTPALKRRSVIDVLIEPLTPQASQPLQDSWTFTRRLYDIRPPIGKDSIVLYQQNKRMNNGESFFIPLNKDLPVGDYRITFTLKQGNDGYISLSRINPGLHQQWQIYRETYDQTD